MIATFTAICFFSKLDVTEEDLSQTAIEADKLARIRVKSQHYLLVTDGVILTCHYERGFIPSTLLKINK